MYCIFHLFTREQNTRKFLNENSMEKTTYCESSMKETITISPEIYLSEKQLKIRNPNKPLDGDTWFVCSSQFSQSVFHEWLRS